MTYLFTADKGGTGLHRFRGTELTGTIPNLPWRTLRSLTLPAGLSAVLAQSGAPICRLDVQGEKQSSWEGQTIPPDEGCVFVCPAGIVTGHFVPEPQGFTEVEFHEAIAFLGLTETSYYGESWIFHMDGGKPFISASATREDFRCVCGPIDAAFAYTVLVAAFFVCLLIPFLYIYRPSALTPCTYLAVTRSTEAPELEA